MDINWLSVLMHCVAARFRGPARVVFVLAAWLAHATSDDFPPGPARDESVAMRHAVGVTAAQHSRMRTVEIVVVERVVDRLVGTVIERVLPL